MNLLVIKPLFKISIDSFDASIDFQLQIRYETLQSYFLLNHLLKKILTGVFLSIESIKSHHRLSSTMHSKYI
jgi:hypothetical protein